MKKLPVFTLSSLVIAMGFQAHAQEAIADTKQIDEKIEKIHIVGVRQDRVSQGATGLTMELNETPQSISVVSAQQIANFGANNLNDALKIATGITVEEWETNRTNYTSRGFDIKSTQIDGVGLPNDWGIVTGAMEAYGYEEIEVIRGANGQLTGVGNAAGTINYVRKRPTNENEGEVGLTLGSFDFKRIEADYSTLLTENGSWAARVVVAVEDKESYLDGLENDRSYIYAVVDGQLTDSSTLTAGFSHQDANTDGNMWGGLVFNYTDGTQAEWKDSASPTQEWTMWDTLDTKAFIEYAHTFDNDWEIKATYNRQSFESKSKLFYVYGAIDKDSGLGLAGWPGRYDNDFSADIFDISTRGNYTLFGQDHELTLGLSRATSNKVSHTYPFDYANTPAYGGLTVAFPYALDAFPEPVWGDKTAYADLDVNLSRIFGSTKLNVSDDLFLVLGFNAIDYTREGVNSGVVIDNDESEISPYAAATYAVTKDINAYVSYSDIYQPQEQYDYDGHFLAPTKGVNFEAGVKTQWLDDSLLATFAIFSAEQQGLPKFAGLNATGQYYYEGTDVKSKGFEVEIAGQVTDNLNALFAYTRLDIEDFAGEDTSEWAARNVINFNVGYTFDNLPQLTVGLGGKWQSETQNTDSNVKQGAYLLANAFARWDIADNLNLQANLNNITDKKYINSLSTIGYYGAPMHGNISLTYSF